MQNYTNDKRIVLTLDAGGTNFVFSAIQSGKPIVDGVSKPSNAQNLDKCLATLVEGFEEIKSSLNAEPEAISFAFPGPADYPNGIIGDLPNFPTFRGGVALGSFLEAKFKVPVFINNDGNLFAYGEALAGMLPTINNDLKSAGNSKQFTNLIGLTLGTGFGAGLVINKQLLLGDNSIAAEVWLLSNRIKPESYAEEIVSAKSLVAEYKKQASSIEPTFTPADIYNLAKGIKPGNQQAAQNAFELFGRGIGDAVANLITLFDGIVVIGGGITGAKEFYMPALLAELNGNFTSQSGKLTPRLVQKAFNYSDEKSRLEFLKPVSTKISVPGSSKKIDYDAIPRVAIAHSEMGASKAIQLGAYIFALNKLALL
jgi:glucokinase